MNAKQIAQGERKLVSKQLFGIGTAPEDFDYKEELAKRKLIHYS